jgi:mono/diheme cytochrome c family protein
MKKTALAVFPTVGVFLAWVGLTAAQSLDEWLAPPQARLLRNPQGPTPDNLKKGRSVFVKNCITCHGEQGRGDGPSARLHARRSGYAPRDLSRTDVQSGLTDGEMFWKISLGWKRQGRIVMPGLGEETPADDRWRVVLYVRSLLEKDVRR